MFIFWGTRRKEKKQGYVAEFCPVCRQVTPFRVSRFGMVSHLYGISMGSEKLLGHAGYCERCGTQTGLDATIYESFAVKPGSDVESLIQATFPAIRKVRAGRLALEERLRTGKLEPQEREALILEPFHIFSELTEANFSGQTQIRGRGGWGCLGTFILAFAVLLGGNAIWHYPSQQERVMGLFFLILVAGGLYSIIQLFLEPGRIFSNRILPSLAAALRPLKPTKEELAASLERFKRAGFKIGKKVKLERLWNAIQANPASPGDSGR